MKTSNQAGRARLRKPSISSRMRYRGGLTADQRARKLDYLAPEIPTADKLEAPQDANEEPPAVQLFANAEQAPADHR